MASINNTALDQALAWCVANGTVLHLCSAEPANYAGIAAVELGQTAVTLTGPTDGTPDGRKVEVPEITLANAADITTAGTATHYALSDGAGVLVATWAIPTPETYSATAKWYTTGAAPIHLRGATDV